MRSEAEIRRAAEMMTFIKEGLAREGCAEDTTIVVSILGASSALDWVLGMDTVACKSFGKLLSKADRCRATSDSVEDTHADA